MTTIYTEEYGNVDISTAEFRFQNGTILFQSSLFWSADENNEFDPGSVTLYSTEDKKEAYRNHDRIRNMSVSAIVFQTIEKEKRLA